jgi:hypothetical protein
LKILNRPEGSRPGGNYFDGCMRWEPMSAIIH